ncbi:MAG: Hsp20/alpha crystallin family protein [Armatimonadetes bacterium]|nr:Hsp20/alpha crystallin family protein [Armatimonadota bacterium]
MSTPAEPRPGIPDGADQVPFPLINMYDTANNDLVIVCAMPGIEPQDVEVEVSDQSCTIRSALRGPRQENKSYLQREFTYGAHSRVIPLPCCVDGQRANVIFRNGLLTLVLPKSRAQQLDFIRLERFADNFGHRIGHDEGIPDSRVHQHTDAALATVARLQEAERPARA